MDYIHFLPFTFQVAIVLAVSVVFIVISGIVSSAEVAFFSLSPKEISDIENNNSPKARKGLTLIESPQKLLATILIANNLVNVAIVILLAYATTHFIYFDSALVGFVFQTIFVTFVLLLFGEILPKIYASQNAVKVSLRTASPLTVLAALFSPLVSVLINSTSLVNSRLGKLNKRNISRMELSHALELTSTSSDEDKEMLEGIIRFGDKRVVDIMTSRVDIVDLDIKMTYKALLKKIIEVGYSRIPVYSQTRDNLKGILYAKDLLPFIDKPDSFKWQTLVRPAYFVPETKMIDDLLNDFQQNKVHLAIVVDEYGGTSGLVTLEDILEEIVGDISDEYDTEEKLYVKLDNHTYVFEAKILLNDFFKIEEIDESLFEKFSGEVETLAGLILELKGDLPAKGEMFDFHHYVFEIMAVDNRRIKKLKLHIKNDPRKSED